ncbi:MAG TPA: TerB family tellurite resistance protein [Cytophagaceae bacterium]
MFMLTIFDTKKEKVQKSHLRNLVALAKADGIISDSEVELVFKAGKKSGFTTEEIADILEDAESIEFKAPLNDADRFDQIYDLVELMLADGNIEDEEMDFCIDLALKLGVRAAIANVLVRQITMGILNKAKKEVIKEQAKNFLVF